VEFSAVSQMASLASPSRCKQQSPGLSRSALKACDALVLEHLPLAVAERFRGAVAIASATARRLFPLVEREDHIQVAREALVRSQRLHHFNLNKHYCSGDFSRSHSSPCWTTKSGLANPQILRATESQKNAIKFKTLASSAMA